MFSKPDCGWVKFTLGDFKARPSYLTDRPIDCVNAFISTMENNLPTSVWFDEEGSEVLLVLSEYNSVFIIHNISDEPAKMNIILVIESLQLNF
ncbi:hypothetical protein [Faecalimicrobium sp. JNUCC 81]